LGEKVGRGNIENKVIYPSEKRSMKYFIGISPYEEGYAKVYTFPPNVKFQERFLKAQREAREEGKGLWK